MSAPSRKTALVAALLVIGGCVTVGKHGEPVEGPHEASKRYVEQRLQDARDGRPTPAFAQTSASV